MRPSDESQYMIQEKVRGKAGMGERSLIFIIQKLIASKGPPSSMLSLNHELQGKTVRLSFPRSSDWAAGASSRADRTSVLGRPSIQLAVRQGCHIRDLCTDERSGCLSARGAFSVFLVGCKVERDEQDQV